MREPLNGSRIVTIGWRSMCQRPTAAAAFSGCGQVARAHEYLCATPTCRRSSDAVKHNRRLRQNLLNRTDVALPNVGADGLDAAAEGGGDSLEPRDDSCLLSVGQHGEHMQSPLIGSGADHRHKVTMAFQECNFIDTQGRE